MSNSRRRLLWVAIALAAVSALFYLLLPSILRHWISATLDDAGWVLVELEMQRPTPFNARVDRLMARRADAGIRIEFADVALTWRPLELLGGRIESVTIASGTVEFAPRTDDSAAVPLMFPPPPRDWIDRIPARHMQAGRLTILYGEGRTATLAMEMSHSGTVTTAQALVEIAQSRVRADLESEGERAVLALTGDAGRVQLAVDYAKRPGLVTAELDLDPRLLREILGPWELPGGADGERLKGALRIEPAGGGKRGGGLLRDSWLMIDRPLVAGQRFSRVSASVTEPLQFAQAADGVWALTAPGRIRASKIAGEGGPQWRVSSAELQVDRLAGGGDGVTAAGALRVDGLRVGLGEAESTPFDIEAPFRLDAEGLSASPLLTMGGQPVVRAELEHALASGKGSARLALETLDLSQRPLSSMAEPWRGDFDLTGGRLSGAARLEWARHLEANLDLVAEGVDGHWGGLALSGLSGRLQAARTAKGWRTREPVELTAAHLDVGVLLAEPRLRLEAEPGDGPWPRLRVASARAGLFGGEAVAEAFAIDPAREHNPVEVRLQGLDLAQLLLLEKQQGVEGSGVLDGTLPVSVGSAGVTVSGGQIAARPPGGAIRYHPSASARSLAESNPGVALAVKALADYRYRALRARVDYAADGTLKLELSLRGNSPGVSTRPIDLNVNLEENVPALLRSLRIGEELGSEIDRRMQQKMQR